MGHGMEAAQKMLSRMEAGELGCCTQSSADTVPRPWDMDAMNYMHKVKGSGHLHDTDDARDHSQKKVTWADEGRTDGGRGIADVSSLSMPETTGMGDCGLETRRPKAPDTYLRSSRGTGLMPVAYNGDCACTSNNCTSQSQCRWNGKPEDQRPKERGPVENSMVVSNGNADQVDKSA